MVCKRVLVHVDERGPVPGRTEASAVRHGANEDAVPVLDGLHLDLLRHALLPAAARLLRAQLR